MIFFNMLQWISSALKWILKYYKTIGVLIYYSVRQHVVWDMVKTGRFFKSRILLYLPLLQSFTQCYRNVMRMSYVNHIYILQRLKGNLGKDITLQHTEYIIDTADYEMKMFVPSRSSMDFSSLATVLSANSARVSA